MQTPGDIYAFQNYDLEAGSVFADNYRVIAKIGSGGIGTVYKVKHILWNQEQALKVMPSGFTEHERKRFENQITALRSLQHPNIIALHEYGIDRTGSPYIAMDFIDGRSLEQILSADRDSVLNSDTDVTESVRSTHTGGSGAKNSGDALSLKRTLEIALQLCDALSYAHQKNVVHRDLKPSNVMITEKSDGTLHVTVLDFDLAKLMQSPDSDVAPLTQPGELLGSAPYMSPEQCRGLEIDGRSDIFSLGCMIFECLTGRPPHLCTTKIETMMHTLDEPAPTLAQVCSKSKRFPKEMERILAKMLVKEPPARYQSVGAVRDDLVNLAESIHTSDLRRGQDTTGHTRWRILSLAIAMSVVGSIMLAIWIFKYVIPKSNPSQTPPDVQSSIDKVQPAPEPKIRFLHNRRLVLLTLSDLENEDYRKLRFPSWSIGKLTLSPDGPSTNAIENMAIGKDDSFDLDLYPSTPISVLDSFSADDLRRSSLLVYYVNDKNLYHILRLRSLDGIRLRADEISDQGLERLVQSYPNLWHLDLSGKAISQKGVQRLKALSNLRTVSLAHFAFKDTSVVRSFNRAYSLSLRDCNLVGSDLVNIPRSGELKLLCLANNPHISDHDLSYLCPISSLQQLDLSGCSIGPKSIVYLKKMQNLDRLRLDSSRWEPRFRASLRAAMPHCDIDLM